LVNAITAKLQTASCCSGNMSDALMEHLQLVIGENWRKKGVSEGNTGLHGAIKIIIVRIKQGGSLRVGGKGGGDFGDLTKKRMITNCHINSN